MKLLNLGCGTSHHPDWINIDFESNHAEVIACNLLGGIPYPDDFFDVVYHSHVLEHFPRAEADKFLAHCFRVLKKGGLLRVVVPDLENIVKCYLEKLQQCLDGVTSANDEYDWIMLELYDQVTRNRSGGEMADFLVNCQPDKRNFIQSRIGAEAENFWAPVDPSTTLKPAGKILQKLRSGKIFHILRQKTAYWLVYLIAGKTSASGFSSGVFRANGEIHQWMYDRFSLERLLKQQGFIEVRICKTGESDIPDFSRYALDQSDGQARKPDSLYIEAKKP